jgi:tRNA threonylcarbamoyladenosine biosynthesis protein TsaE
MGTTAEFVTQSVAETRAWGTQLARCLQPGDVVALDGPLGAGKTHLVQGILEGLDFPREHVTSPTFTLIQEYPARVPVCHCDAYRLRDVDEFLELGVDELLGSEVICLIEWAERVAEVLPRDRLSIVLQVTGETARIIKIGASGPRSEQILQRLLD